MKKFKYIAVLTLLISMLSYMNNADAQIAGPAIDILLNVDVSSCSTGDCEIITRQYTGVYNKYSIAIRCQDTAGNFGSWNYWDYDGINPGTYCQE
ncbi:hypothetical protein [Gracilimonas sp.]|uniref:hypothetical protein n=1 Tax=Gracilimonas sp. TaxID=1974203 RepID=UPI002870CDF6|nr:hypothetical protein [Gracilimonas sp.]